MHSSAFINIFWSCNFLSCQPNDKNKRMLLHLSAAKEDNDNKGWSPVKQIPTVWDRQRSFNSWYSCWEIQALAWFSLWFVCLLHSNKQPDFWTWMSRFLYFTVVQKYLPHSFYWRRKRMINWSLALTLIGFKTQVHYLIFRVFFN